MGRRRGGEDPRRSKNRPPTRDTGRKRVVYVFAEGEVTEAQYIDLIMDLGTPLDPGKPVTHRIMSSTFASKDRKPIRLVNAAIPTVREVTRTATKSGLTEDHWAWPQVWCLFDRDQHEQIPDAFQKARAHGINIAYSHPCFELWRLLHYQNYTSTFGGVCDDANDRLRTQPGFAQTYGPRVMHVSKDQSKHVKPGQLEGRYEEARAHAQRLNARHQDQHDPNKWDPYTDVWEFVEQGLLRARY